MKIKFPTHFNIQYPSTNKKYYNENNKRVLIELLLKASKGYCMYCGNKIVVNNDLNGQLEHSVEKKQNGYDIEYLKHCKYNMSLACHRCNQSSKKKNILPINVKRQYSCSKTCESMCDEYIKNCNEHFQKNQIILMPQGLQNTNSVPYEIEYDLLKLLFVPCKNSQYTSKDISSILSHIERFGLNSAKNMPIQIIDVCSDFIEGVSLNNKSKRKRFGI